MNIVEKDGVYQLILPGQIIEDLDLKTDIGHPLVIVHGDPVKLEVLYKNIEFQHRAWLKMINRISLARKKSLYLAIADLIFAVVLFIADRSLTAILRVPAWLILSAAFCILVSALYHYRVWKKMPKRGIPLLTPAIIELRERIEKEYGE